MFAVFLTFHAFLIEPAPLRYCCGANLFDKTCIAPHAWEGKEHEECEGSIFSLILAVIEHDFCASEARPLHFPSPADILKTAGNGGNL